MFVSSSTRSAQPSETACHSRAESAPIAASSAASHHGDDDAQTPAAQAPSPDPETARRGSAVGGRHAALRQQELVIAATSRCTSEGLRSLMQRVRQDAADSAVRPSGLAARARVAAALSTTPADTISPELLSRAAEAAALAANGLARAPVSWLHATMRQIMDIEKASEAKLLGRYGFNSVWMNTGIQAVPRLHTLQAGTPGACPTMVFLHGFASQGVDWGAIPKWMRDRTDRIILIDAAGHGRSPIPESMTAQTLTVTSVEAMRKALAEDEQCILVGNSMGCLGAIRMYQHTALKKHIRGMVLISPVGAQPADATDVEHLLGNFNLQTYEDACAFIDRVFINGTRLRTLLALGAWAHINRPHLQQLLAEYRSYPFLTPDELAAVDVPMLLIQGGGDRFVSAHDQAYFRTHLNATLTTWQGPEDFSHSPYLDRAKPLFDIMITWFKSHPGFIKP